ncbi:hypothetical protein RGQ15_18145 [Paracoccus sp. MBLB3053]|uniref:Copper-binding protein n=1 Tax=Paracoccus aurantius TaxID=3073814 RepID=A0ABU2HY86_9RHOB|nr:hypothetical protein [Paracoccus sp. MBLB3053]MDS9469490.1 hypothetical protein [Paracoccus sp. MBLB3053]
MKAVSLALALALTPFAVHAEAVTLNEPLSGATLISHETDVSFYFSETDTEAFRIHASYVAKIDHGNPKHLMMDLRDGDSVSFSLPAHLNEVLTFSRDGDSVTVKNDPITLRFDENS